VERGLSVWRVYRNCLFPFSKTQGMSMTWICFHVLLLTEILLVHLPSRVIAWRRWHRSSSIWQTLSTVNQQVRLGSSMQAPESLPGCSRSVGFGRSRSWQDNWWFGGSARMFMSSRVHGCIPFCTTSARSNPACSACSCLEAWGTHWHPVSSPHQIRCADPPG